jgi:hypothetical protein
VDGKVHVEAYRHDVKIHLKAALSRGSTEGSKEGRASDVIVREGERSTRSEHCGAIAKPADGVTADGAILNSSWAKWLGVGAVAVITCLGLCHTDDPLSPSIP